MNIYASCDDISVDYHDVDHLGLSQPLHEEDSDSEDENNQGCQSIGMSPKSPVYILKKDQLVYMAGNHIIAYNMKTHVKKHFFDYKQENLIYSFKIIRMFPSRKFICTYGNGEIAIWQVKKRKKIASLKTEDVLDLCLINESQDLATSKSSSDLVALVQSANSPSKTLKIWNWSCENIDNSQFFLQAHTDISAELTAGLDIGRIIGSSHSDFIAQESEELKLFTVRSGSIDGPKDYCKKTLGRFSSTVMTSYAIITGTTKGKIISWPRPTSNLTSFQPIKIMDSDLSVITSLDLNDRYLVVGDKRGKMEIFTLESLTLAFKFRLSTATISNISSLTVEENKKGFTNYLSVESENQDSVEMLLDYWPCLNKLLLVCNDSETRVFQIFVDKIDRQDVDNSCIAPNYFSRVLLDFSRFQRITVLDIHPKGSENDAISSVKFSPKGLSLVCCTSEGKIWITEIHNGFSLPYDPKARASIPFHDSKSKILLCKFSGEHLFAAVNINGFIMAYQKFGNSWNFLGKVRPHKGSIRDFVFVEAAMDVVHQHTGVKRTLISIFSIGEDRRLAETTLKEKRGQLEVKSLCLFEDTHHPTFIHKLKCNFTGQTFLMIGNSNNQICLVCSETMFCRRIFKFASSVEIKEIKLKMDSDHNFFAAKTLSTGFLQIFAISTRCWTVHTISILKYDLSLNEDLTFCFSATGEVFCSVGGFFHRWQNVFKQIFLNKSSCSIERVKLTQEAFEKLEEIRECVKILAGNDPYEQDFVKFHQVFVLLNAIGLSPNDFELENFLNKFRFGLTSETGLLEDKLDVKRFLAIVQNHFFFPSELS